VSWRERRQELARRFRVEDGSGFELASVDPADTAGIESKRDARRWLERGRERLSELQELLYAQDRWSLLLIFQAIDAAGKDGAVEHVMSGVNPQGCQVFSFKAPSAEELDHDFLWRTTRCLPERGRIGIFNRSYYEEVLVVRVHPELLEKQKLPRRLVKGSIWEERFESIVAFERHLARNGVVILKFFLHLSREEQRQRFLARLDRPEKHWKFSPADVRERRHWDDYQRAYEQMIRATATPEAPWMVVPADHKWFTRLAVAAAVVEALEGLELAFPAVAEHARAELAAARAELEGEAGASSD
jgi:PPK2 family polyphosphate:nucleotide phosphotransferase